MSSQQMLLGTGVKEKVYLDDYFSILHYTGRVGAGDQRLYTNIDLSTSGNKGAIIISNQEQNSGSGSVRIYDTLRGASKPMVLSSDGAESTRTNDMIKTFHTDGFTYDVSTAWYGNDEAHTSAWTFRAAAGFFDVLTYTGSGSNRTIAHGLESVPGMIWIKKYSNTGNWCCYHRSLNGGTNPEQYQIRVNSHDAKEDSATHWNDTAPTASVFSLGTNNDVNENGETYVAYLWAHRDNRWGESGDQNVIECSYYMAAQQNYRTGLGGGHEVGMMFIKNESDDNFSYSGDDAVWGILDNKRGHTTGVDKSGAEQRRYGQDAMKRWKDTSGNQPTSETYFDCQVTGFNTFGRHDYNSGYGDNYIYVNIIDPYTGRVSKPVETALNAGYFGCGKTGDDGNNGNYRAYDADNANRWSADFVFYRGLGNGQHWTAYNRQTGNTRYYMNRTDQGQTGGVPNKFSIQAGFGDGGDSDSGFLFRRHSGFGSGCYFGQQDNYKDNDVSNLGAGFIPHHTGQVPKMIWVMHRDTLSTTSTSFTGAWTVYHYGMNGGSSPEGKYMQLHSTAAQSSSSTVWANTAPDNVKFKVGADDLTGTSGREYIFVCFCDSAVSKMGYYTGAGNSNTTVTCGFRPSAVMIKNSSSTSGWKWIQNNTEESWTGLPTSDTGNDTKYLISHDETALAGAGAGTLIYTTATGFVVKPNVTNHDMNASGDNYIWAAWG
tara:strand:+ start:1419 stop:3557 length:2139 start_codon:yes stop_codon:yes gene_type:complete